MTAEPLAIARLSVILKDDPGTCVIGSQPYVMSRARRRYEIVDAVKVELGTTTIISPDSRYLNVTWPSNWPRSAAFAAFDAFAFVCGSGGSLDSPRLLADYPSHMTEWLEGGM